MTDIRNPTSAGSRRQAHHYVVGEIGQRAQVCRGLTENGIPDRRIGSSCNRVWNCDCVHTVTANSSASDSFKLQLTIRAFVILRFDVVRIASSPKDTIRKLRFGRSGLRIGTNNSKHQQTLDGRQAPIPTSNATSVAIAIAVTVRISIYVAITIPSVTVATSVSTIADLSVDVSKLTWENSV